MPDARPSLLPRLEEAADRRRSITFVTGATDSAAYTTEAVEWARIHDDARAMAAELQARGRRARPLGRADRPDHP